MGVKFLGSIKILGGNLKIGKKPPIIIEPTGSQYWRFIGTATHVQFRTSAFIREIEMMETTGGGAVDVTSTSFAIAVSERTEFELFKEKAFNNNNIDAWQSEPTFEGDPNHWVGQNFGVGNEKNIVQVTIFTESNNESWDIEKSDDGIVWTFAGTTGNLAILETLYTIVL